VYRVIVALILSICTANVSLTWGVKGHKVVGAIAMVHLTDSARQQVENLLGSDLQQFIEVATWADEVRFQRRGTLETLPFDGLRYEATRDCRNKMAGVLGDGAQ